MLTTKLQLVQHILSRLGRTGVTTIGETIDSEQVSLIIDSVYEDILSKYPWPHLNIYSNLEVTSINYKMKIPSNIFHIDWIKYDGKSLIYLFPEVFIDKLDSRDQSLDNVDSYGAYNDSNPNYWTSVDEEYILFDSYNQNLVSNKARFFGTRTPSTMTLDTDEPDLPQQFRSVLLYGSLAEAFYTLKSDDSLGDRYARHFKEGLTAMKKWARTVNKEKDTAYNVDYGRKVFSSQVTNRNIIDD